MLKKVFITLSTAAVAFFLTLGISHAETLTSGKMYDTFQKQYQDENYDFKKGSFQLQHVKTINLSTPITVKNGDKKVQVSTVKAGIATFKTVRDQIFLKDWKEYAYYAPDAGLVLTEGDVMKLKPIKAFQDKYTSDVSLELGPIAGLLVLFIIVPIIFGFIWLKFKYNSMDFKLKNHLLDPEPKSR